MSIKAVIKKTGTKMRLKSEIMERTDEMRILFAKMQKEGNLTHTNKIKIKAYIHCLEWVLGFPDKIW